MPRLAHALLTTRHNDLAVTATDSLITRRNGTQARTTQLVQSYCGLFNRDTGSDRSLAGRVLAGRCGKDLAQDDLRHLFGGHPSPRQGGTDRHTTEFAGGQRAQSTIKGTGWRSRSTGNYDVIFSCHVFSSLLGNI